MTTGATDGGTGNAENGGGGPLGALATLIRTKNAGPFWMTIDVFLADNQDYQRVAQSGALTAQVIARLYECDPTTVLLFHLPDIRVIKASFPRPFVQGSFLDRDMHSGQQHIPMAGLIIPTSTTAPSITAPSATARS